MKKDQRGQLKVPSDLHAEIAHASIDEKKDMYELVREAWEAYKREKLRREPMPADQDLIQRLLRFWHEPVGMEIAVRRVVALCIELPVPDDGRNEKSE